MTIDPLGSRRAFATSSSETEKHVVSVREVLAIEARDDVTVKEGTALDLEPDGAHASLFHRVRLSSFDDLTGLKLIPELDEASVRAAIRRDDAEALAIARDHLRSRPVSSSCGCSGSSRSALAGPDGTQEQHAAGSDYSSALRSAYAGVRRAHHPALVEVYRESTGLQIDWDDKELQGIRRWTSVVGDRQTTTPVIVVVSTIKNITILKNSTLSVSNNTTKMFAKDIRIHVGGRLIIKTPFISINCASVRGNIS